MHKFQTYSLPLKLKMLRLEAGKSQEEFSAELGISRSCLANYETGKRYPGSEVIAKIADVCNILPNFLADTPPYREITVNEAEVDHTKKLKKLIQDRGTTLDISHLPLEHRITMVAFYDYVLNQQNHNSPNRVYRVR